MWFNIIPGFAIVCAGVAAPGYALYWLHYLVLGNHYRRSVLDRWERSQYQRDWRLSGDVYKVNGLELIDEYQPTEDEKTKRVTPDGVRYNPPK